MQRPHGRITPRPPPSPSPVFVAGPEIGTTRGCSSNLALPQHPPRSSPSKPPLLDNSRQEHSCSAIVVRSPAWPRVPGWVRGGWGRHPGLVHDVLESARGLDRRPSRRQAMSAARILSIMLSNRVRDARRPARLVLGARLTRVGRRAGSHSLAEIGDDSSSCLTYAVAVGGALGAVPPSSSPR